MAKGSGGTPSNVLSEILGISGSNDEDLSTLISKLRGVDDRTLTHLRDLLDSVLTGQTNLTGFEYGQHTVGTGGDRSPLNGGTTLEIPDNFVVRVKALTNNSSPVYIGDSSVDDTNGFQLTKNSGLLVAIDDISKIYVYAPSAGDGVSWFVENS